MNAMELNRTECTVVHVQVMPRSDHEMKDGEGEMEGKKKENTKIFVLFGKRISNTLE